MKSILTLISSLILFTSAIPAVAQNMEENQDAEPGFLVFNQYKIPYANLSDMHAYQDSIITPIFDELVEEGKLIGWGLLEHAWGDEWNYNWYFIAEDHRAFLDFWDEFIDMTNERFPEWSEEIFPLIDKHKDNMYNITIMR